MSAMLAVLLVLAWRRWPAGIVGRINLLFCSAAALLLVGFDLANRILPHWVAPSLAGVVLALLLVSILRNEDGQRDRLMRWYLRIPPLG